ncbi:uncharacterized protein METZ01_LOCUS196793, partial [marine metagenome]
EGVQSPQNIINVGEWTHIAISVELNQETSLYVNGENVSISAYNGILTSIISPSGPMYIGEDVYHDNQNLNGVIDEVQIWNVSLTESQIQSYMATSPMGNESGLVGYWRFDENSGTTVHDLSGNTNHGTINGAAWSAEIPDQIPPDSPTGLAASAGDHLIDLTWAANSAGDLNGYKIYRTKGAAAYALITTSVADTLSYTDSTALNDSLYYYYITAIDLARNESSTSDTVSARPVDTAPAVPVDQAITASDGQVSMSWTANKEWDIKEYNIYQGTSTGFTASVSNLVFTLSHPVISKTITGLTNGQEYYFIITAEDSAGNESTASSELAVTPVDVAPVTPQNFSGFGAEDQVTMNWTANTEWDIQGYYLYRSTASSFTPSATNLLTTLASNLSQYVDTGVASGTLYYYRLSAYDATENESDYTAEIAVYPSGQRYALLMDGSNDYGRIESSSTMALADSMSIEVWLQATAADGAVVYRQTSTGSSSAYWSLEVSSWSIRFKGRTSTGSTFDLSSGISAQDQWRHVAVSVSSDSILLVIDGVRSTASSHPGGQLSTGVRTWVGVDGIVVPVGDNRFSGSIC